MEAGGRADRVFDVVVAGNGVLGLSLAVTLARQRARVALLGEPHRPWAASAAAGAMLGCFGEVTESGLGSPHGRARHQLAVRAAARWDEWLAELTEETGAARLRTAEGTVVLLNSVGAPGVDDANFRAIRSSLVDHGEPFEEPDPHDIQWLDPDPGARPLRALYLPHEHAIDAAALLAQLEAAFVRAGGTLITDPAVRVEHSAGAARGVVLASGARLSAPDTVLAAGVRAQDLLDTVPEAAHGVPRLVSGVGVSALVHTATSDTPATVLRTPNRAFACGLHVLPRADHEVYVGATNIISPEPLTTPVMRDVLFLLHCATRQVRRDLWEGALHRLQVGNRPIALDGFPLIGSTPVPGLWAMTGTYRDGLHLSPLLAAEMAARLLGGQPREDLSAFAPARAPIQAMTRQEAVIAAVTHMLATGYESGWSIPVEWPAIIEDHLLASYARFADEIHPDFTPPPELIAAARLHPSLVKLLRDYYAAYHRPA